MSINQFLSTLKILPADAIVLHKKFFGMLDHFVIYLGVQGNNHTFVANYTQGVRVIPNDEIVKFLQTYVPTNVDRFPGGPVERQHALQRAIKAIGQHAYSIVSNNCEHFKNYVHYGITKSNQVANVGTGLAVGGLAVTALGAETKNTKAVGVGIAMTVFGLIALAIEESNNQSKKK